MLRIFNSGRLLPPRYTQGFVFAVDMLHVTPPARGTINRSGIAGGHNSYSCVALVMHSVVINRITIENLERTGHGAVCRALQLHGRYVARGRAPCDLRHADLSASF